MIGEHRYLPEELPVPEVTEFTRAFLTSGALAVQTCLACSAVQHPPGELCFSCGEMDFEYVPVDPVGTISSYTVVHHVTHRSLVGAVPYNVIIVELDHPAGIRIVGNLVDAEPGELAIGQAVSGFWTMPLHRENQEPVRLLQWRAIRTD